jgi:recombination protein RecR
VADEGIREVILALNATVDGQTTAHYIADVLAGTGAQITLAGARRRAALHRRL